VKPGHGPNTDLARSLGKQRAKLLSMVPKSVIPKGGSVLDINDVMSILPHRYPFLLVDRIVEFEGDNKGTGIKSVTINEPYFQGHFPGHPVMPGVLQLEAMAQVASIVLLRARKQSGSIGYFMSADEVKFRKPVFPGDTLFINVELTKAKGRVAKAIGHCVVNNEIVSEASMMFGILDK
jgi:UDP-3-O-[3-hydroxymyristoyl] N-acetylglucosamine deacetylase/3-hydroxyacyl-[acyl-carrier-protein] dehydratase